MKRYTYDVHEEIPGGQTDAADETGTYNTKSDAALAMQIAMSRKHGATCIRRDGNGGSRNMVLGLVKSV